MSGDKVYVTRVGGGDPGVVFYTLVLTVLMILVGETCAEFYNQTCKGKPVTEGYFSSSVAALGKGMKFIGIINDDPMKTSWLCSNGKKEVYVFKVKKR